MSVARLRVSLLLTGAFVAAEAIVGARAHSLALLSDAGHNFTDALALLLSWYALTAARKPATPTKTYGYHRVGILTALFNALTLMAIALFIFHEAYTLVLHPRQVESAPMIGMALIAVALNAGIAISLRGDASHNLNIRSAYIHMAGDALSAVGVVAAGVIIHFTGWNLADALVALLIGAFIAASSWSIVVETINVLLEGTPRGLDVRAMAAAIEALPGVQNVHDLHVWTIADGMNALSCHLRIRDAQIPQAQGVVQAVKVMLAGRYSVRHSTIETECAGCDSPELYCSLPLSDGAHDHGDGACSHSHE